MSATFNNKDKKLVLTSDVDILQERLQSGSQRDTLYHGARYVTNITLVLCHTIKALTTKEMAFRDNKIRFTSEGNKEPKAAIIHKTDQGLERK